MMPSILGAIAASGNSGTGSGSTPPLYSLPTILGLEFWWSARNVVVTTGSDIDQITDNHTTGRNATPNSSNKPQLIQNAYNGLPAVEMTTSSIDFTATSSSNSWSVFIVAQRLTAAAVSIGSLPISAYLRVGELSSSGGDGLREIDYRDGATTILGQYDQSIENGLAIYEWHVDAGSVELKVNGAIVGTGTAANSFALRRIYGTGAGFSNAGSRWTDALGYTQRVENNNQITLRSAIAQQYNITLP